MKEKISEMGDANTLKGMEKKSYRSMEINPSRFFSKFNL